TNMSITLGGEVLSISPPRLSDLLSCTGSVGRAIADSTSSLLNSSVLPLAPQIKLAFHHMENVSRSSAGWIELPLWTIWLVAILLLVALPVAGLLTPGICRMREASRPWYWWTVTAPLHLYWLPVTLYRRWSSRRTATGAY